jgi:hypothetical protein
MFRPTPKTATKICGICRAGSMEYEDFYASYILPINCGSEAPGVSLTVDFELPHFNGTLLLCIKQTPRNVDKTSYTNSSYFDGKKSKFQAIVKGHFKTPLVMSKCITGQSFD